MHDRLKKTTQCLLSYKKTGSKRELTFFCLKWDSACEIYIPRHLDYISSSKQESPFLRLRLSGNSSLSFAYMQSPPYYTPLFTVDGNGGPPSRIPAPHQDMYRAAHRGDWETTSSILIHHPYLRVAKLNSDSETALHVAVGTGKAIDYVQKLLEIMQPHELEKLDEDGQTPLMVATLIGNIDAAELLVHKNPGLLYLKDFEGLLPVHRAAQYGQKNILLYLLKVTSRDDPSPYAAESGAMLLSYIMEAEFYDVATSLIRCFPGLIDESHIERHSITPPLAMLAANPSAFRRMCFWERIMYACIPINWQISYDHCSIGSGKRGEEYQRQQLQCPPGTFRYLASFFQLIRPTKHIRDQAIQLVNELCSHASHRSRLTMEMYEKPLFLAAESGIVEIVEELAETFPNILWKKNNEGRNIFQVAVSFRQHSVYSLVYRMAKDKRYKIRAPDNLGNNILHMAAKLAPLHRLNTVSGAALNMGCELQWFKEVGKSIQPLQRQARNNDGKTPKQLFTEEHVKLVKEGEIWMKSTANSCTTPAALIATVVFAAAITVPMSNIGKPGETAFAVFAIADALSLFTSLLSLLEFVSILTSRYTEDEFLYDLPVRILIGLITLVISIASMMVAFSMILYLTFAGGKAWILGAVVSAACVPASWFVILNYSLLANMISYWSLPRILGEKGERPLYTRLTRRQG